MRIRYEYRTTSKEVYSRFKKKNPTIKLSYTEWCNILYSFNYEFRDYCLETGLKAKFPAGFGEFCITKYKIKSTKEWEGKEYIKLPIDWKKTKEKGFKVYHMNAHTEGYKFRWLWLFGSQRFFYSELWTFKPSRISSRLIKHYISNGYDQKYLQWKK